MGDMSLSALQSMPSWCHCNSTKEESCLSRGLCILGLQALSEASTRHPWHDFWVWGADCEIVTANGEWVSFQIIRIVESAVMMYEEMQPSRDFSKTEAQSSMPKKSLELDRKHLSDTFECFYISKYRLFTRVRLWNVRGGGPVSTKCKPWERRETGQTQDTGWVGTRDSSLHSTG